MAVWNATNSPVTLTTLKEIIMATPKDIYRVTFNTDEVFAILDLMDQARNGTVCGLNPVLLGYYKKVDTLAYGIGKGHAKPAYTATGVRKESAVNMDSLGASDVERAAVSGGRIMDRDRLATLPEHEYIATFAQANHEVMTGIRLPLSEFLHGGSMFNKVEGVDMIPELDAVGDSRSVSVSELGDINSVIGNDEHATDNDNMYQAFKQQYPNNGNN